MFINSSVNMNKNEKKNKFTKMSRFLSVAHAIIKQKYKKTKNNQ